MEAVMGVANAMGDMVVNERLTVDGVDVLVGYANEGDQHVTETEIRAYLERGALKHPNSAVTGLALLVDGEDVDIRYELAPVPFDRSPFRILYSCHLRKPHPNQKVAHRVKDARFPRFANAVKHLRSLTGRRSVKAAGCLPAPTVPRTTRRHPPV